MLNKIISKRLSETKTTIVNLHKVDGKRPEFDVYIGRRVPSTEFQKASIWCNPYKPNNEKDYDKEYLLDHYETYIRSCIKHFPKIYKIRELKGKKLGCWCINTESVEPLVCHGQILLKIIKEMN